jgi:hypothetical protein
MANEAHERFAMLCQRSRSRRLEEKQSRKNERQKKEMLLQLLVGSKIPKDMGSRVLILVCHLLLR